MSRRNKFKSIIGLGISTAGLFMILAAIGANLLGLDRDAGWGPARYFLLGCGSALALSPHITWIVKKIWSQDLLRPLSNWLIRFQNSYSISRFQKWFAGIIVCQGSSFVVIRRKRRVDIFLTIAMLFTVGVLTWIVSIGTWFDWPDTTNYFHLQAQAFKSGQLHLSVVPSDQILLLADPYTFENRKEIPYLWDASLYDGNYYLYWGPTPGIITAVFESLQETEIGDQFLVYFFTIGSISFSLLALRLIWNRYFPNLAAWTILPLAFLICLGNPAPWLLGRPAVYEAAIASGQFFFMGGLLWFLMGMSPGNRRNLFITMSGVFFVGALGSRFTLLPGILILSVVGFKHVLKDDHGNGKVLITFFRRYSIYYGLVFIGLILLAWYNYARFGSIFEFGHRYQLTSWGMASSYRDFFSWRNIVPNLYNYFLNGFRTLSVFPFIKPIWGVAGIPFLRATAVANYHAEQVAGILFTSPIILVGCFPVFLACRKVWAWLDEPEKKTRDVFMLFISNEGNTIYAGMLVLTLSLLLPLSLISFNSMRYLFDFSLAASFTSAIGIGITFLSEKVSSIFKGFMAILILVLSLYSAFVGILLGITSYTARFEHLNPELFEQITRFFAF